MRKAAKVYEAGESVDGAKPKVVYESHKKCTPGEFGSQVKEALVKAADSDKDKSPASSARNDRKRRAKNRAEDLVPMQGFGRGYADYLLPSTFGGTRAGRATMIAKALGKKPDFSVSHPNTDTLLSSLGGSIFGGMGGMALGGLGGALTGSLENAATGAILGGSLGGGVGSIAGAAGSGMQRREQMQKIQDSLAGELEQHGTSRLKLDAPQYSALSSILQPLSGAHRAGQADAYEALRDNTRYNATPGRTAGYLAAHVPYAGPLINMGHGMAQNFSARDRMKQDQVPQMPIDDEFGLKEFGRAKAAAYVFGAHMKAAFEKAALPAFGGRNYSLAPRGTGIGLNAGYDYIGGVLPAPYLGVDVGTPHTGVNISGPIPGVGFRSGMFTRPPGATSGHNRTNYGHRSLWQYLADSYAERDPKEIEDEVHDDRMQSMRNVTKDEFHEAIPDYHEGTKGKPMSKDLHKALTEYYYTHSRPEKKSDALEFGSKVAFNKAAKGGALGRVATSAGKYINSAIAPTIKSVRNATTTLAKSPQAVGTEAMLEARRLARPSTWNGAGSPGLAAAYRQSKLLKNPNYTYQHGREFNGLRNSGVDHDTAARVAAQVTPQFIPRRDVLLQAGSQAANRHVVKQLGVAGAGAAGVTALDQARIALMNQPEPMVSPQMQNLFQGFRPAAQPDLLDTLDKPETPDNGMTKMQSAYEFGGKVAFSIDWNALNALKNPALGGAAAGAMVGGVHGLLSPGEDENGKKRNRFGAMLRGVLGGGAVGGIGGAAAGHFAPGPTNDFMNRLRYQYTMNTPVPTQAQARTRQNFNAAQEEPHEEDGMVNQAMRAAQG